LASSGEVAIVGTFDVRNYGDLLFPLIADWRLDTHGFKVQAYSPAGIATNWADTAPCCSMGELLNRKEDVSGFLIGGGNILHTAAARLREYRGNMDKWAYPSLWEGTTLLAAIADRPVVWNAPGVARPIDNVTLRRAVHPVMRASEYVNVRDANSFHWLKIPQGAKVEVVPDTAADLGRMWPKPTLADHFAAMLHRKGFATDNHDRFMAVHVKRRSLTGTDEESLARRIDALAAQSGMTPILVAIGLCHGDDAVAENVGSRLTTPSIVLSDPLGLKEIAAAIAFSDRYIGCSLHGYITACAYDVPGRLVAIPELPKHAGFLAHVSRPEDLSKDWEEALSVAGARAEAPAIRESLFSALDQHWDRVATSLLNPVDDARMQRNILLRRFVANGLAREGWSWTLPGLWLAR
jgi:polysaccharide pyruvyl transferase WcaK-like protein